MTSLKHTAAAIPSGNTRRTYGTAFWDGEKWFANINGNLLDARWLDPIQPVQNGKIVVDITKDEYGLSSALVIGGYTDQPRPSTGTVVTVGVDEIAFTGEDGKPYETSRFTGSYSPEDPVHLTWAAGSPTIIGVIGAAVVVPPTPAPLPEPPPITGETPLIATASDTWWGPGGWGSYATSRFGGEDVYSGTWGSSTVTGAWFYGAPKPELQGKTITRIRFRLPGRLNVGASGAATVHFHAHTSGARPGSDVARVAGPHDVVVAHNSGPDWHDLPLSFAPALVGGGGISIAGNPYVGFNSRLDDPESGKLLINWST